MTPTANSVIFDIGNVLVRWDPRFLFEKLIDDPDELDWFLSHVVTLDWHTQHDAGRSFAETIPERARQFPDYAHLIEAFHTRWDETIAGPIDEAVRVLERLAGKGVPAFALTNYSAETFPAFRRRFGFAALFEDILVSGEVGIVKPDPRIYRTAIGRFGVDPGRCVFIDDRHDNVAVARDEGLIGYHFAAPEALADDLRGFGLPL